MRAIETRGTIINVNYASSSELDLIVSIDISCTVRLVHLTMSYRGGKGKHVHNIGDARYSAAGNCSIDETAGRYPGYLARRRRDLRDSFFQRNHFFNPVIKDRYARTIEPTRLKEEINRAARKYSHSFSIIFASRGRASPGHHEIRLISHVSSTTNSSNVLIVCRRELIGLREKFLFYPEVLRGITNQCVQQICRTSREILRVLLSG